MTTAALQQRRIAIYDFILVFRKCEKIEQPLYKPGENLRVPGGSQISTKSAHEGGKVVSPTQMPPLPSRMYFWYSFLSEAESNPGP